MKNLIKIIIPGIIAAVALFLFLNLLLKIDWHYAVIDSIITVLFFGSISSGFKYYAKFIELSQFGLIKFIAGHTAASLIITFLWIILTYFFFEYIADEFITSTAFFYDSLILRFIFGLLIFFLITAINYLIIYYKNYRTKVLHEAELKNLITEAEIKSLKFQINPHFIFNSLNSIAALTSIDPEKAREMTIKLADFLRYTLSNNNRKMNTLSEEITNVRRYLAIEKIRFGDKFNYLEEVNDSLFNMEVPNMILQPLFENAIKYGVYDALENITISMKGNFENGYMRIAVENNVEEAPLRNSKGEGVGLVNINERLKLIYDQSNLIKIEKGTNYFRVVLYIPVTNN